jgi:hypothetical protein
MMVLIVYCLTSNQNLFFFLSDQFEFSQMVDILNKDKVSVQDKLL